VNAQMSVTADTIATNEQQIRIGDIPPGNFGLFFDCLIIEPTRQAEIIIEVEWGQILSRDRLKISLVVPLKAALSTVPPVCRT
jgi:hypothetical protein